MFIWNNDDDDGEQSQKGKIHIKRENDELPNRVDDESDILYETSEFITIKGT